MKRYGKVNFDMRTDSTIPCKRWNVTGTCLHTEASLTNGGLHHVRCRSKNSTAYGGGGGEHVVFIWLLIKHTRCLDKPSPCRPLSWSFKAPIGKEQMLPQQPYHSYLRSVNT